MEMKVPGESLLADVFSEVSRWFYLAGQFFETHHGLFATLSIVLMASITVAVLYYLLPRATLTRFVAVTLAVGAGLAFIIQAVLAVSVPRLYENYGRGHVAACQVFERDDDGNYIYDPFPVMVEGEVKVAMIARKIIYQVESPVFVAMENGRETMGFLITPTANAGDLPTYCGLPFNDDARALIENISMQQQPVDTISLQQALLMKKLGYVAFEFATSPHAVDKNGNNVGVLMFMRHVMQQLNKQQLQPLSQSDLLHVLHEAAEAIPGHQKVFVRSLARRFFHEALVELGVSWRHADQLSSQWINNVGKLNDDIRNLIIGKTSLDDTLSPEMLTFAMMEYGLTREAVKEVIKVVLERVSLNYSSIFARYVVEYLEEARLHERKPLIVLPGEPPYYLTEPGRQQGQEGQEGDGQDQGKQGQQSQGEPAESLEGLLEGNMNDEITGERFGPHQNEQSGGEKDDSDRS